MQIKTKSIIDERELIVIPNITAFKVLSNQRLRDFKGLFGHRTRIKRELESGPSYPFRLSRWK